MNQPGTGDYRRGPAGCQRRRLGFLAVAALALTALNAVKPLHVDDPFILRVAERAAEHPADPYGFDIFWLQWPQPVHEELTPPVTPYWWALGLAWLPDHPAAWKLWFLPFALLLAWGLDGLLLRFAPRAGPAFAACALLSAAILPSFNLMQDVPALALALAGLRLGLAAIDEDRLGLALGAGAVLGLATQTKYTAVSALAALAIAGVLARRWQPAVLACATATLVFFGWEWAMTLRYGQGMFLGQVDHGLFWVPRLQMIVPGLGRLGLAAAPLAPLAAAALGLRAPAVVAGSAALAAGFAAPLLVDGFAGPFQAACGALVLVAAPAAALRLGARGAGARAATATLLLWLAVEIVVYFAAAPFPAVRRVLGAAAVLFLLAARAWSAAEARPRRAAAGATAALALALGLGVQAVDTAEAVAQRAAVERIADEARRRGLPPERVWFVGHWGFQHHAEDAGFRPVVPDASRLAAGDLLVVPDGLDRQDIALDAADAAPLGTLALGGPRGLRTLPGFYGGGSAALDGLRGARLTVDLFRLRRDATPRTAWPVERLVDWAAQAGGRTAAAAGPALAGRLADPDPRARRLAAIGLGALGPRAAPWSGALRRAAADPHPEVAAAARWALGAIGAHGEPVEPGNGPDGTLY